VRRPIRWLTRLLPPDHYLAAALLCYLIIECGAWLVASSAKDFLQPANLSPVRELFRTRDCLLIAAALAYGLWRVASFHPFYRPAYAEWLQQLPWTSRHRLPAGPIHLAAQDVIVASVLAAAMHSTAWPRQWIPAAILAGHSAAIGLATFWTGPRPVAYVIGLLLGFVLLFMKDANIALAAAGSSSLVAHAAIRSSLARFPWENMPEPVTRFFLAALGRQAELPKPVLGYPYVGLSPQPPQPPLPLFDGVALSLLPAWWAFAASANAPSDETAAVMLGMPLMYLVPALLSWRCWIYLANCRPPISLWGRIMTGRWIIPGYDRALAAPLMTPCLVIGLFIVGHQWHISLRFVFTACIAGALLVTINMGPSLRVWRLTGAYRLVPTKDRRTLIEL
jgi:hypothetical protein